jgi:SAM-dependent methyltransferase
MEHDVISEILDNPRKRTLILTAKQDLFCEPEFFITKGGQLLIDLHELQYGRQQQGLIGQIYAPYRQWYAEGKIDLEISMLTIQNRLDSDFAGFLKKKYNDTPLVGAEVGVYEGEHAMRLLETLNIRKLYLIDAYDENPQFSYRSPLAQAKEFARDRLRSYKDRIQWIYKRSEHAIEDIQEPLDFAYLDSQHDRDTVGVEIPLYYDAVSPGGVLGGHDNSNRVRGGYVVEVRSCVDEFVVKHNIQTLQYNDSKLIWLIQKAEIMDKRREGDSSMKIWNTDSNGDPRIVHDSRLNGLTDIGDIQEIQAENRAQEAKMIEELNFWRNVYNNNGIEAFLESRRAGYVNLCHHLPRMLKQEGQGLDLGCGMVSVYEYGNPRQSVTAIDPLLPWYNVICTKPESRVTYVIEYRDDGRVPLPDDTFDFVSCINVIDHTAFHKELIGEVNRVLKPGGLLYFNVNFDPVLSLPNHIKLWNREVVGAELSMFKRLDEHIRWNDYHKKDYYWAVFRSQK